MKKAAQNNLVPIHLNINSGEAGHGLSEQEKRIIENMASIFVDSIFKFVEAEHENSLPVHKDF